MSILDIKEEIFKIKRRLLEILKENEHKTLSEEEYDIVKQEIRDLYKEYLKLYVMYSKLPDAEQEWDYDNNCYHYALNLPTPDIFINVYDRIFFEDFSIEVGAISNLPYIYDDEYSLDVLLNDFYTDLNTLNIKKYPSTIYGSPLHNGFKVAVFYDDINKDYHFIRQNSDGSWSQKFGPDRTICFSESPLSFLNNSPLDDSKEHFYEYVETLELVKPTISR